LCIIAQGFRGSIEVSEVFYFATSKLPMMTERAGLISAPDFSLTDTQKNLVQLSSFRGKRHVVLVFNRGFM
jgi:peroxiredoxin